MAGEVSMGRSTGCKRLGPAEQAHLIPFSLLRTGLVATPSFQTIPLQALLGFPNFFTGNASGWCLAVRNNSVNGPGCLHQVYLLPMCWGHLTLPVMYQTPSVSSNHYTPLHNFASCWEKPHWTFPANKSPGCLSLVLKWFPSPCLTFSFIFSTFCLSWGTTLLGGKPFSSWVTNLAYLVTWPVRTSGSKQSNLDCGIKKKNS